MSRTEKAPLRSLSAEKAEGCPEGTEDVQRSFFLSSITLALFLLFLMADVAKAQSQIFEELKTRFQEGVVFKADFKHSYTDAYTGDVSSSEGMIWIDQNGYKLESEDKVIVVDGELSQVYEAFRNRLIISEYDPEEDDFAPSRMLSGLDDTYSASQEKLSGGNTLITLVTQDDFATFLTVEIEVNAELEPLKITAYDFADNVIVTTFTNGSFENRTEDTFKLDVPEDAEIVDMRN
ncbi:MAG: LolA family protein [Balneola sp.]